MNIPPYAVALRVADRERTKFRIWFPLFLLWPLALPFLVLSFVATLAVDLFRLAAGHKGGYTRLLVGVLGVVHETRGVEVFVEDATRTVALRLQ
jgi:hypothetical protein